RVKDSRSAQRGDAYELRRARDVDGDWMPDLSLDEGLRRTGDALGFALARDEPLERRRNGLRHVSPLPTGVESRVQHTCRSDHRPSRARIATESSPRDVYAPEALYGNS